MALSDSEKESLASWMDEGTRETERLWVENLNKVVPIYMEHGYSRGEAAILFMLSTIMNQCIGMKNYLKDMAGDE